MAELTSRQRVQKAVDHQQTDRPPIDFGSSRITGISAIAYKNLLDHLGAKEDIYVYDIKQQLALPSLEMINRMAGDVVGINRLGPTTAMPFLEIDRWKDGKLTDGSPCKLPEACDMVSHGDGTFDIVYEGNLVATRSRFSLYFDIAPCRLQYAETKKDIDDWQFPDPWSEREEKFLKDQIDRFYHGTDKALFASLPQMNSSFFELGATLFGFETFMTNLLLKRDMIEHWLERLLVHDLEILDKFLAVAGPYISVIGMSDDFGAQEALMIPPQLYREMFKPRQKKWIEFVKARTDAKIFLHCDGMVEPILEDFIEVGIDILNPLQSCAKGMDPKRIKAKYGQDLCFWGGGVETQSTLPFGSVEEIRRQVKERIDILSPAGGFVFATIHNIQADVAPEKILAVFDTARNYQPRIK